MKGVSFQPLKHRNSQKANLALWGKWLDVESTSLRFSLKGGVPNVVGKAALLCSSNLARDSKHPKHDWRVWVQGVHLEVVVASFRDHHGQEGFPKSCPCLSH